MKILRLILDDQLNEQHSWFKDTHRDILYVMMEVRQETDYVLHHVQKMLCVFAAMRRFADRLRSMGKEVLYLRINDRENHQQFDANLEELIRTHGIDRFEYQLPDEYRVDRQIKDFCDQLKIPFMSFDTEHFLTERGELKALFEGKKRLLMETFYRHMRRKLDILMESGSPPHLSSNRDAAQTLQFSWPARTIPSLQERSPDCYASLAHPPQARVCLATDGTYP